MSSNTKKILVPDSLGAEGFALLRARPDIETVPYDPALGATAFHAMLADAAGVALSFTRFGAAELAAAPALQVVARIGVGFDAVDVPALSARRIPLMVVGTANSTSVAEQAVFFILALAKRVAVLDRLVREGRWGERFAYLPEEVAGRSVLIVGFGRIGTRAAARCAAFGMRVFVHDPFVPAAAITAAGFQPVADLDAALGEADFVSLHCPLNETTRGLFATARLARMKRGAFLVNTARGGLIDEAALQAALNSGHLAGAALDVLCTEPPPREHPLLALDNVILAPHMAGVTVASVAAMAAATARNLLSVLDGAPIRENAVDPTVFA